ncbi:hypothetical protein DRQ09_08630, partial [candidate division KSB1 bacterium]
LKFIFFFSFVFLIAGVVLSFSRGGAISLFIVLLILLFIKRKERFVWIPGVITILFFVFFIPVEFWERINTLSSFSSGMSLRNRLRLAEGALTIFINNPLFGIGLGNFTGVSNRFIYFHQNVHNTFLEIAAETGIFGLSSFVLILLICFKNMVKSCKKFFATGQMENYIIAKSIFIGFTGFLVSSLFLSLEFDFVFWIIIALSSILSIISKDK